MVCAPNVVTPYHAWSNMQNGVRYLACRHRSAALVCDHRRRANRRLTTRLTVMSFYAQRGSTASSGLISSRQSFASQ